MSAASDLSEAGLLIAGMNCDKCVAKVNKAIREVPGVQAAQVDLKGGNAVVKFDPKTANPQAIADAVSQAGYPAKPTTQAK
jgi:copper ion binding protein